MVAVDITTLVIMATEPGQKILFEYEHDDALVTFCGAVLDKDESKGTFRLDMDGCIEEFELSNVTDVFLIDL